MTAKTFDEWIRSAYNAGCASQQKAVNKYAQEFNEIEQTLGKALGYPWYKDDQKNFPGATDANGVCVGEHVPSTIALEAARKIESQQGEIEQLRDMLDDMYLIRRMVAKRLGVEYEPHQSLNERIIERIDQQQGGGLRAAETFEKWLEEVLELVPDRVKPLFDDIKPFIQAAWNAGSASRYDDERDNAEQPDITQLKKEVERLREALIDLKKQHPLRPWIIAHVDKALTGEDG